MKELFKKLHDTLKKGNDAVLVTIVAGSGATPRGSGAKMLVTREGRIAGTIGGGSVEFESIKLAKEALAARGSSSQYFRLQKNDVADIGMICGGDVDVYFKYLSAADRNAVAVSELINDMFEKGEQSWLITETGEKNDGELAVYSRDRGLFGGMILNGEGYGIPQTVIDRLGNKPVQVEDCGRSFYAEKLVQSGTVYVFGGGHVSQQLVPILNRCEFRVTVVEDRDEFLDPALFENTADSLVKADMNDLSAITASMNKDDYAVIMTRGHKDDFLAELQVLKTPACYIGVIGSRFKTAAVNEKLKEAGCTDRDLERVTSPIGLDIGSETPAEIAVSIAAQLISVRADRLKTGKA